MLSRQGVDHIISQRIDKRSPRGRDESGITQMNPQTGFLDGLFRRHMPHGTQWNLAAASVKPGGVPPQPIRLW